MDKLKNIVVETRAALYLSSRTGTSHVLLALFPLYSDVLTYHQKVPILRLTLLTKKNARGPTEDTKCNQGVIFKIGDG